MRSRALSRAGEPHSLGILPRFYPLGANAFSPRTSPLSPALWGQNWLSSGNCPSSRDPQSPGRRGGVPRGHLPSLFTGAPGWSRASWARAIGVWAGERPDNSANSAPLLSIAVPRPFSSPCSHQTPGSGCWNTWGWRPSSAKTGHCAQTLG